MGCLGEAAAASLMMVLGHVSHFSFIFHFYFILFIFPSPSLFLLRNRVSEQRNLPNILAVARDAGGGLQLLTHDGSGSVEMASCCCYRCRRRRLESRGDCYQGAPEESEERCGDREWRLHGTDLRVETSQSTVRGGGKYRGASVAAGPLRNPGFRFVTATPGSVFVHCRTVRHRHARCRGVDSSAMAQSGGPEPDLQGTAAVLGTKQQHHSSRHSTWASPTKSTPMRLVLYVNFCLGKGKKETKETRERRNKRATIKRKGYRKELSTS